MSSSLLRTKPLTLVLKETEDGEHGLRRALKAWDLVAIGIGCIIGVGIFVLPGVEAANHAGPGHHPLVRDRGRRLRVRRALLRGAGRHDPGRRAAPTPTATPRLGELRGVDHRLGPDPGVHGRREPGGDRLVGVPRQPDQSPAPAVRREPAARLVRATVGTRRSATGHSQPAGCADRRGTHVAARARDQGERPRQPHDGDHQGHRDPDLHRADRLVCQPQQLDIRSCRSVSKAS